MNKELISYALKLQNETVKLFTSILSKIQPQTIESKAILDKVNSVYKDALTSLDEPEKNNNIVNLSITAEKVLAKCMKVYDLSMVCEIREILENDFSSYHKKMIEDENMECCNCGDRKGTSNCKTCDDNYSNWQQPLPKGCIQ